MKTEKEILAPAGSIEAMYAAVKCGANAIYMGGKAFNARRNASNFTVDELKAAIEYCHARSVKVYITLNTLVGDGEIDEARKEIECACSLSTDALILQDTGLCSLVKSIAPDMPMHASTQMSVQSADGVRLLQDAGFSRVVLARELSRDEIRKIADETEVELEVFVHGALCMCVSGQCLLSSMLGGRSGNRGLCAQPCRLPFGVNGNEGHALSLKDLSLIDRLDDLSSIGVSSFKIEGRMKRPEYVAAAVTACRKSLSNEDDGEMYENLQAVFSRSGFTKGYYEGKTGPDMFGVRRREDVTAAAPVLKKLSHLYDKEFPDIRVDFAVTCVENEPISLCAGANGKNVFSVSDTAPEKAINKPLTEDALRERIAKCGGTQFYAGSIDVELDEGVTASAGVLNALRRDALEKLDKALACKPAVKFSTDYRYSFVPHKTEQKKIYARFSDSKQIPENLDGISSIILPLGTDTDTIQTLKAKKLTVYVEVPRAVFSNGDKYRRLLQKAKNDGVDGAVAGCIDSVSIAKESGLPVSAGFGTNLFNTVSLDVAEKYGLTEVVLSPELSLAQVQKLGGTIPRGIIAYGHLPLMLTRNCPVRTRIDCAACKGKSHLTDRMGVEFPVICSNGCSELLNSRPIYLADRLREIKNVDFIELYFTIESKDECADIIEAYENGKAPNGEFTRGLYYRGAE